MSDSPIWDKIHQLDADIAALQPTQKGWLPKWLDEHLKKWVAANNQLIYESTQAFWVDPSAGTRTPTPPSLPSPCPVPARPRSPPRPNLTRNTRPRRSWPSSSPDGNPVLWG